jgi:L-alanine-DL-glutamate epimerase-like enolase superfamily enzyme
MNTKPDRVATLIKRHRERALCVEALEVPRARAMARAARVLAQETIAGASLYASTGEMRERAREVVEAARERAPEGDEVAVEAVCIAMQQQAQQIAKQLLMRATEFDEAALRLEGERLSLIETIGLLESDEATG